MNTSYGVVERPDPHCGDDPVKLLSIELENISYSASAKLSLLRALFRNDGGLFLSAVVYLTCSEIKM